MMRRAVFVLLFAAAAAAQTTSPAAIMEHTMTAMSVPEVDMGPHMKLTSLRPARAGDQQRADAIVEAARGVMARYRDYHQALAAGYRIFLPNVPMRIYHFTNWWYGARAGFRFDPDRPTSLLYEKTQHGYKLIGLMYTAPARMTEAQLDSRIPLSVARWHEHVNLCGSPKGQEREYFGAHPKFGLLGSITTEQECRAAGGRFRSHVFGWMVHVYPDEHTSQAIWSVERQMPH